MTKRTTNGLPVRPCQPAALTDAADADVRFALPGHRPLNVLELQHRRRAVPALDDPLRWLAGPAPWRS